MILVKWMYQLDYHINLTTPQISQQKAHSAALTIVTEKHNRNSVLLTDLASYDWCWHRVVVRWRIQYREEFGILVNDECHPVAVIIHAVRLDTTGYPQEIGHNLYCGFSLLQPTASMHDLLCVECDMKSHSLSPCSWLAKTVIKYSKIEDSTKKMLLPQQVQCECTADKTEPPAPICHKICQMSRIFTVRAMLARY